MHRFPKSPFDAISTLTAGNLPTMCETQRAESPADRNRKIERLVSQLAALFAERPGSKVIIFVQRQDVARYLATCLGAENPTFRANEFTAAGRVEGQKGKFSSSSFYLVPFLFCLLGINYVTCW